MRKSIVTGILVLILMLGFVAMVSAQGPLPPRPPIGSPNEVPEADTLLLLGGGMSGLGVWMRWQWSKRRT
jgi:hypothetical protein